MEKKELEQKVDEILERGTIVEILPTKEEFRERLLSGEKMKFYIGFDATAPTLHLSHAKNLMLLEKFRKLGHEVVVLFGDFTARIGDPTGEKSARKQLTREDVMKNVEVWKKLIKPLMDFENKSNPPIIKYNNDWLAKLTFEDIINLSSNLTVQQILERDMFEKRMKEGQPIHLHEFLYPLMQGYDSVAMDVDVELCGTDQIFNALTGRTLLKKLKNKNKFVVAVTLMEDPKTGELMSKSKGTGVFLDASASDMYGQIMSQTDEMIKILFINVTNLSFEEIEENMKLENPRDAKMKLAFEIAKIFHGEDDAKKAQESFVNTIQKKEIPEDVLEQKVKWVEAYDDYENVMDYMASAGLAESKSDARRKIEQGGVEIDGEKIIVGVLILNKENHNGKIIKVGKKNFRKIVF